MTLSDEAVERAARETGRLQRELNITNADHIALWIEANTIPDEPMSQCASWLACRIVEAHEAALEASDQSEQIKALEDKLATAREALEPSGDTKAAYMGEFSFTIMQAQEDEDGEAIECPVKVYVPWTTIKEIMAAIRTRAALDAIKEKK